MRRRALSLTHKRGDRCLGGGLRHRMQGLLRRLALQDISERTANPGCGYPKQGLRVQQCAAKSSWRFLNLGNSLGNRLGLILSKRARVLVERHVRGNSLQQRIELSGERLSVWQARDPLDPGNVLALGDARAG